MPKPTLAPLLLAAALAACASKTAAPAACRGATFDINAPAVAAAPDPRPAASTAAVAPETPQ